MLPLYGRTIYFCHFSQVFYFFLFRLTVLDLKTESRKHQHFASNPIMLAFMTRVIKISRKILVNIEEVI